MTTPAIQQLPSIAIEGHKSSGQGGPDHPMRVVTRRAAGLEAGGWTDELRDKVTGLFDELAAEWHTRTTPQRVAVVTDALTRGLDAMASSTPLGAGPSTALWAGHAGLADRKSTCLNSSHVSESRMPSSA